MLGKVNPTNYLLHVGNRFLWDKTKCTLKIMKECRIVKCWCCWRIWFIVTFSHLQASDSIMGLGIWSHDIAEQQRKLVLEAGSYIMPSICHWLWVQLCSMFERWRISTQSATPTYLICTGTGSFTIPHLPMSASRNMYSHEKNSTDTVFNTNLFKLKKYILKLKCIMLYTLRSLML